MSRNWGPVFQQVSSDDQKTQGVTVFLKFHFGNLLSTALANNITKCTNWIKLYTCRHTKGKFLLCQIVSSFLSVFTYSMYCPAHNCSSWKFLGWQTADVLELNLGLDTSAFKAVETHVCCYGFFRSCRRMQMSVLKWRQTASIKASAVQSE